METCELKQALIYGSNKLDWSVCVVNERMHFACVLALASGTILFCFVPTVDEEPYIAILPRRALQEQCQEQGFWDKSILQIETHLGSQTSHLSSGLSFQKKGETMELSLTISSALKVLLRAKTVEIESNLSSILFRKLLNDVLCGSILLRNQLVSTENSIQDKDRALSFLVDHLEDTGNGSALDRWAPSGSQNSLAIQKFETGRIREAIFESLDHKGFEQKNMAEMAEILFTMKRNLDVYKMQNPPSPSKKRKAARTGSDFAPIQDSGAVGQPTGLQKNEDTKIEPAPLLEPECTIKCESARSSREPSESPTKRRKFRKVKVSKESLDQL